MKVITCRASSYWSEGPCGVSNGIQLSLLSYWLSAMSISQQYIRHPSATLVVHVFRESL